MSELIFYEKPGCVGNRRQQGLLNRLGVAFVVRDLLSETWDAERLRPFFADLRVPCWFNESAPKVKSGELPVGQLDEREALCLMIREPILIRRPLLEYGMLKQSGFVPGVVLDALGVELEGGDDLQHCPMIDSETICEVPE
ncbi:MAG: nitrogenase-associated protein [Candidatus Promineifilaceae bacterium]